MLTWNSLAQHDHCKSYYCGFLNILLVLKMRKLKHIEGREAAPSRTVTISSVSSISQP